MKNLCGGGSPPAKRTITWKQSKRQYETDVHNGVVPGYDLSIMKAGQTLFDITASILDG